MGMHTAASFVMEQIWLPNRDPRASVECLSSAGRSPATTPPLHPGGRSMSEKGSGRQNDRRFSVEIKHAAVWPLCRRIHPHLARTHSLA